MRHAAQKIERRESVGVGPSGDEADGKLQAVLGIVLSGFQVFTQNCEAVELG